MDDRIRAEIDRARTRPGAAPWTPPFPNLARLLAERARATPDSEFLSFFDDERALSRRWSYAEAEASVARAAGYLASLGVREGDRVAFLCGNLDHTLLLYLATWALGACVAPISAAETDERKAFILDNSGARVLLARDRYLDEARALVATRKVTLLEVNDSEDAVAAYPRVADTAIPVSLEDASYDAVGCEALLVYTSGTTGPPKGVRIDQRNLMANADSMATWHDFGASLRTMCVLPVHHVNGIVVTLLMPLYVGGSTVLNTRFNSLNFWQRVGQERVTLISLVPTLLEFLMEAETGSDEYDRSTLETLICGAGPLLVETAAAFEARFGIPITHGYGLSETTCYNCHLPRDLSDGERRAWLTQHGFPSIGVAMPHQELAILDAQGHPVAPAERGEICVRGDSVSLGYHNRDEANADAFRDGWFHSGDEGFALCDDRERNFFFITGRIKELIIRGGINYSPLEIDEVLNSHPDVHFGLAVPFANRYYGDEIAAYVVPQESARLDPDDLLAFCRRRLDFARSPKVVVIGTEIPYTTTGKPKRIELSQSLADELSVHRATQFRRPKTAPAH